MTDTGIKRADNICNFLYRYMDQKVVEDYPSTPCYCRSAGITSSFYMVNMQKLGGNAMLVDAEHAFDPAYSKALGVDVENLIVCQPDHGEMALEIADRMCRSGAIDLICVDSVSALTPRAEIEGEIGMQQMGLQARLMSQALRKMSGNASKAGCTLIFLNQIRYKIGVYYGNPEVTSGGIALKFFASLRLEIRPIGKIKSSKGDEDIGLRVRVRVQKSKGCILDCAELMDVVVKKGSGIAMGTIGGKGVGEVSSTSSHDEVMAELGCSNGGLGSAHCPRQPSNAFSQGLEKCFSPRKQTFLGLEKLPPCAACSLCANAALRLS
ncbi:DNA repair protein recA-like 1, chloroplastic [Vitis vinifera]|uniref:DNA repair protein recA-like 1, chloroplastic n=1 Tax=Vitis vinifera TaxID=29760 RepID=A0A438DNL1_VITVI|nr:DNA repair protein recA-like 1, chloroplastic [Vitis vinifera]